MFTPFFLFRPTFALCTLHLMRYRIQRNTRFRMGSYSLSGQEFHLLTQPGFAWRTKGIGRVYQQTFIDTYSRVSFAKVYEQKTAITAADLLNDRVLPWFEQQGIPLLRILTDRGTEYCGKVENHAYQLYLGIENIDHSKTKVRSPQTNGICERLHKTIKNEFYDIALRKKIYSSLEALQADLDTWLINYNTLRPHSGKYCYGKTPMQAFEDSKHIAIEKNYGNVEETADSTMQLTIENHYSDDDAK